MKSIFLASCIGILAFATADAQELANFTADIGAGFTEPAYSTGSYVNTGWNLNAGVAYNYSRYLGAKLDIGFNDFGINGTTLTALGAPNGDIHMFSALVDPVFHLTPHSRLDIYVTGGGGLFHESQQITAPAAINATGSLPIIGSTAVSSYVVNRPGWDAGAGVSFAAFGHARAFAEAKFERMLMSNGPNFDMLPVTFGFRF